MRLARTKGLIQNLPEAVFGQAGFRVVELRVCVYVKTTTFVFPLPTVLFLQKYNYTED